MTAFNVDVNNMNIECKLDCIFSCRFSDKDIEIIKYCFDHTSAVLHSTLVVQNERRLKKQTQVGCIHISYKQGGITQLVDRPPLNLGTRVRIPVGA